MHEMSIVMRLVDIAADHAKRSNAKKVDKVIVQVGELTGAVPSYLEMFYPAVVEGTILDGSELVVETVEALVFCKDCGRTYNPVKEPDMKCPVCTSQKCDVIEGNGILVKCIVIADEEVVA